MSKLIIAEKPSVAKSIASALGASSRADGFYEGSGLLVSWCVGHLVSPMDAGGYDERFKKWRYDDLPILPEPFRYVLALGKEDAFENLRTLMNRPDVDTIVNACDAGREGELIFRLVYEMTGCRKPVIRLWISSMEDSAIREGFSDLRPDADYEALYQSALCRQKADWLVGINATRLFSVLYHRTLNVGRVQTPTLAMLAERDAKITLFHKEKYHLLRLTLNGAEAVSEKFTDPAEAEQAAAMCKGAAITCTSVTKEQKKEQPPKLYDLTTLQREANRLFGYTAKQTLDYAQSLYEKKLLTYPRTDSRYLTSDMAETASCVIHLAAKVPPFDGISNFFPLVEAMVSDKDVSDHHAIIPTGVPPTGLTDMEANVYDLIAKRFISVFYPDCKFSTTTVLGEVINEDGPKPEKIEFKVSGKEILEPGWRVVYAKDAKNADDDDADNANGNDGGNAGDGNGNGTKKEVVEERTLPSFVKGESGDHQPTLTEKWTTPPKYYTEATLLRAMETAGKFVEDEELRAALKENGIGRPSSRAGIIETLFKRHYIRRQRKNLMATPTGIELIDTIHEELLKSCELTGIWEKKLRDIEHKTYDPAEFINGLKEQINQIVIDVLSDNSSRRVTIMTEEDLKKKPEKKKTAAKKAETKKPEAKKKDAATQDAAQPASTSQAPADPMVGKPCPLCGKGVIIKGKTAYGCSNWKSGCQYRQPFSQM